MTEELPPTRIAMLLYPKFTTLDLVGPHQVLAGLPGTITDLVATTREPVTSDTGVVITPDKGFDECEPDYDVLLVPGGVGTHMVVQDARVLSFVRRIAHGAKYITSVCTGSLILGAAGLLSGYRAASHWAFRDLLSMYGAIPDDGRVVIDRNRITGGGVTAGVDFGLRLAARLAGEQTAKLRQLVMEYDPHPPFDSGTPHRADAEVLTRARRQLAPGVDSMRHVAQRFRSNAPIDSKANR